MSRSSSAVDRQVRIELLRTRAALERETLSEQLSQATRAWRPGSLLRAALAGVGVGKKGKWEWLPTQLLSMAKRYPLLGSTLSTLLLSRIGGRRIVRVATIGLAGWELYKAWRDSREPEEAGGDRGSRRVRSEDR